MPRKLRLRLTPHGVPCGGVRSGRLRRYREEMAAGSSVQDVITRLRRIDDELPRGDGAAVFNRMYLTVTEIGCRRTRR